MPLFFKHQRNARPQMPWGVVGAIGGAVVNNVMAPSGGGAGSSSSSKEPWANAQPLLVQNLNQAYGLQQQMQQQPFSPQQTAAYNNSYALGDYERGLVPGLLSQLGSQPVGFDPNNPTAKQQPWDWTAGGLLGAVGKPDLNQQSVQNVAPPPASAAPPAAAAAPASQFQQQTFTSPGGYGSFKYGDKPDPGSQAYRDMQEYWSYGGADPYNTYGRAPAQTLSGDGA